MSRRRLMPGRGRLAVALLAVFGSVDCKRSPAPPPPPTPAPPATEDGLRPLTSRDGGPGAGGAPAAPGAAQTLPPGHPPLSGRLSAPPLPADEGTSLTGTVTLAASLRSRVAATEVLYLIARNARTNAVVAVRREQDVRFPHSFQISAADQMMEGTAFTGPFDVTARISRTGDAIPGKGDLEGTVKGVAAGARGVSITIDSVRQ